MMETEYETYQSGGDISLDFPKSLSYFYPLQPIGLGTSLVESLPSFLMRLADAHCLSVGALLKYGIGQFIENKFGSKSGSLILNQRNATRLYVPSQTTEMIIDALIELTGEEKLKALEPMNWINTISMTEVLRKKREWCPDCLTEWIEHKEVMYEPLLWNFRLIEVCSKHKRKLSGICSRCNKELPYLSEGARIGYCNYCNNWLGTEEASGVKTNLDSDEWKWQLFVTTNIQELLESRYSSSFNMGILRCNIAKLGNTFSSKSSAATNLGIDNSTFRTWTHNINISLNNLLKLAYLFDCKVVTLMTKALTNAPSIVNVLPSLNKVVERKSRLDLSQAKTYLLDVLQHQDGQTPSQSQIARELGTTVETLRSHFNAECAEIAARYKEGKKMEKILNRQNFLERIRECTKQIYLEGRFPSIKAVMERLNYHILYDKEGLQVWGDTMRELGLR